MERTKKREPSQSRKEHILVWLLLSGLAVMRKTQWLPTMTIMTYKTNLTIKTTRQTLE